MPTTNLGWIKSIKKGTTPPTNLDMDWLDTNVGVNVKKYYDTSLSAWVSYVNRYLNITDHAAIIANLQNSSNWNGAGKYTGSTTNMLRGDTYLDEDNYIKYEYDGTVVVRIQINTI